VTDVPENENETPPADAGEENAEETQQTDEAEVENTEEAEEETEEGGEDSLPDWARKKLTKANTEAANYRTKLRDAEKALENAKTPEEVETILNGWKNEREEQERKDAEDARALLIENIALKHRLPEKIASRLVGNTREELEADAKELAADFAIEDDENVFLEGGLSPRNRDSDSDDPRELAKKYGGRKRRT
jgi:hypothetical protein